MKPATHREHIKDRVKKSRTSDSLNQTVARGQKSSHDLHSQNEGLVPFRWQKKTGRAGSLIESFYHAFHGIQIGLKEQRNLRIHFVAAPLVVCMGVFLNIDTVSWLALVFAMGLVISTEFINTAIEHLVDISAEGQYKYAARCAKDTAASAVLTASFAAIAVGLIVFLPKLMALFG